MLKDRGVAQMQRIGWGIVWVWVLVGCAAASPTSVAVVPTSALLPITPTHTSTPVPPTATRSAANLVNPADLVTPAVPTPLVPLLDNPALPEDELTQAIFSRVAADVGVDEARVRWISADEATFFSDDLSCILPRDITLREALRFYDDANARSGHRYQMLVGDVIYTYHATDAQIVLCPQTERLVDDLLLLLDPVAADMFAVVQRRVAEQRDLAQQRVQLVSMTPYVWRDSSLGCPRPDQTYTLGRIGGYRIVVRTGDSEFLFHTDSITAIPCEPEFEQLPD